jgi:hypothetical protein
MVQMEFPSFDALRVMLMNPPPTTTNYRLGNSRGLALPVANGLVGKGLVVNVWVAARGVVHC